MRPTLLRSRQDHDDGANWRYRTQCSLHVQGQRAIFVPDAMPRAIRRGTALCGLCDNGRGLTAIEWRACEQQRSHEREDHPAAEAKIKEQIQQAPDEQHNEHSRQSGAKEAEIFLGDHHVPGNGLWY